MLHGLPISFLLFQAAFIQSLSSDSDFPEGSHRERYIQMLDACSLRRPHITAQQEYRKRIIARRACGIQAQQHANHPMLVELKKDQEATDQLVEWKKRLEKDENWLSLAGFEPGLQLECNGLGPIDRHYVIRRPFEAEPSQVMLATRPQEDRASISSASMPSSNAGGGRRRSDMTQRALGFFIPNAQILGIIFDEFIFTRGRASERAIIATTMLA
ncbi:global transactivator [Fusarium pseudocircinatum]|uniref:Global transactivator n=1 Tax=Fusarium pseudocircinatum TaxID=56676 RepID=A0A8H5KU64_9HYPO|nr:global transactivator [Fusarium pseudocircinatum]